MANFGPLQNSTTSTNITTVDYVGETNHYADLGADNSTEGFGWNITFNLFIYTVAQKWTVFKSLFAPVIID